MLPRLNRQCVTVSAITDPPSLVPAGGEATATVRYLAADR